MSSKASSPTPTPTPTLPSVSTLLRETFSLYKNHAGVILGYAGWMLLPLIGVVLVRITMGSGDLGDQLTYILSGISLALNVWVFASIAESARQLKQHGKLAPTSLPLLTTFFVLVAYSILIFAGLTLFAIPGLLFMTWFGYAPLIAVLERGGFVASFVTSKNLVQGMFWQTFGRIWGMYFVVIAAYLLLSFGLAFLYPELLAFQPTATLPLPADIVLSIAEIFLTPVIIIYLTLLYLARKNG